MSVRTSCSSPRAHAAEKLGSSKAANVGAPPASAVGGSGESSSSSSHSLSLLSSLFLLPSPSSSSADDLCPTNEPYGCRI